MLLASTSIVSSLLLVHYLPKRFRIHPYPYLSDAGLRDPERIVLSFGLALSAAFFVLVAVGLHHAQEMRREKTRAAGHRKLILSLGATERRSPKSERTKQCLRISCDNLPRSGLRFGLLLSFFLALFTAIPGWFFLHHLFALVFALCAAAWCLCHALFSHALFCLEKNNRSHRADPIVLMYVLVAVQIAVIVLFGTVWLSVKLQIPYKMIPNKDFRFVILALLEYTGTTSFLTFIAVVSAELKKDKIRLLITLQKQDVESDDILGRVQLV